MEITLSKVVEAARRRRAAVTAEGGGYIVLLALQQLAISPRQITAELIGLTAAGEIELGPSPPAQPREVETQLRQLLAALLCLPQSVPPALRAAGERAPVGDLAALEAELSAALIPINHAAARRGLARLFRETQKATRAASSAEPNEREASSPLLPTAAPVVAATPLPAAAPVVAATPLPPVVPVLGLTELEIDVDVMEDVAGWLDGSVALDSRDSTVVADGSVAADSTVAQPIEVVNGIAAAATEVGAATDVPAPNSVAAPAEVDASDDVDIVVDDLHELLTAEVTPSELRFTSLSSSPLIVSRQDDARTESPLPDSSPFAADAESDPPPQRSDLRDLLHGYLAHTRCEEHMTADLRRMIGLEPWRALGAALEGTELGR